MESREKQAATAARRLREDAQKLEVLLAEIEGAKSVAPDRLLEVGDLIDGCALGLAHIAHCVNEENREVL